MCEPKRDEETRRLKSCDKHGGTIYFKRAMCPMCKRDAGEKSQSSGGNRQQDVIEIAQALATVMGKATPWQGRKRKHEAWEVSDEEHDEDKEDNPRAKLNALLKGM